MSPTESIISKKGTIADIKLQVSVWQKATIWCVFYTLQNLRDKWEAVKKWFLTQNNNDPKNKLTNHIQQIYLSIYHLHSVTILSYIFFKNRFEFLLMLKSTHFWCIFDTQKIFFFAYSKIRVTRLLRSMILVETVLYSFFRKSSSNGLIDDSTPRIMRDSTNI